MTIELVLFIIVAAVAIFSAMLMIVSRNAVHSALFLVLNFLCVAFFYLMLNAPFLAMVQITVYAGAIMVLFMFVIMLLGSERLGGGVTKYSWIATGAVVLTTIFLIIAFIAIVQGQIGLLKPVPPQPEVRFIHAAAGVPEVDVYLNETPAVQNLAYGKPTAFEAVRAGSYNLLLFAACTEEDRAKCVSPIQAGAAPLLALPLTLEPETDTAFIIAGTPASLRVLSIPIDLSTPADENTSRLTAVNALPESGPVSLRELDELNPTNDVVVAPALNYGDAAPVLTLKRGEYDFVWRSGDTRIAAAPDFTLRGKTHAMLILTAEEIMTVQGTPTTRPALLRIEAVPTREAYGSPQQIGVALLTTYLLPFELVALLLLSAMVGAIILTREEVVRRERRRFVVSPVIKRINRAAAPAAAPPASLPAQTSVASSQQGVETSAD